MYFALPCLIAKGYPGIIKKFAQAGNWMARYIGNWDGIHYVMIIGQTTYRYIVTWSNCFGRICCTISWLVLFGMGSVVRGVSRKEKKLLIVYCGWYYFSEWSWMITIRKDASVDVSTVKSRNTFLQGGTLQWYLYPCIGWYWFHQTTKHTYIDICIYVDRRNIYIYLQICYRHDIYIYICIYLYIYTYVYIYIYICIWHIHVCVWKYMIYIYIHM